MGNAPLHWADITADKIIREKGDKELYTVASGITPSGRVHFGNFRETITVDLVARALRSKGKKVRFIFSWDEFDTFRKVPADLPNKELVEPYLFQPIVDVPDPWGTASSYARNRIEIYEKELEHVGVNPECLYQSDKYRAGEYLEQIKLTLRKTETIREILNRYRSKPLAEGWLPVSVYCPEKKTDQMKSLSFDGEHTLHYVHESGYEGSIDLSSEGAAHYVKLPWRVDWPMRWAFESVDFEPGGKDHSSDGGSFTTAKDIVNEVYGGTPPVYLQYDFVRIKGGPGKMSSSKGGVVTIDDLLEVFEPTMLRWIFAKYKPNVDFSIGLDEDVIKLYEEFDRQERLALGIEQGNAKKVALAERIFELSKVDADKPLEPSYQPSFRHLTTMLQIYDLDIARTKEAYASDLKTDADVARFEMRAACAVNWLKKYAPADFTFAVNTEKAEVEVSAEAATFCDNLKTVLSNEWESFDTDKALHERMYEVIHEQGLQPQEAFLALYNKLISREKGPRLASFMRALGKDRVLPLL